MSEMRLSEPIQRAEAAKMSVSRLRPAAERGAPRCSRIVLGHLDALGIHGLAIVLDEEVPVALRPERALRRGSGFAISWTSPPHRPTYAPLDMETVIFACVHNAGRSQMATAWFNELADPTRARAVSAGTQPGSRVHPEVVTVMQESGIDVSGNQPRLLTTEVARGARLLITMGCSEECPAVPGLDRDDWPLPDPEGQPLKRVREIRDEVRARVAALIASRGWTR
jgi:arsenate reductase